MFEALEGNDSAKQNLAELLKSGAFTGTFLFAGPPLGSQLAFAKEIASHLLNIKTKRQHPDLHIYEPEGKIALHTIDSMRSFISEVYLAPLESTRKVFIINDADRMQLPSANALLKTLEEPSLNSVIILVTSKPDAILPTIRSRCRLIRFTELAAASPNEKVLTILSQGKWATWLELSLAAKEIAEAEIQDPEASENTIATQHMAYTDSILQTILSWYRDLELLQVQGNHSYLLNPAHLSALQNSTSHVPLHEVQAIITDAKTAVSRSTPFHHVLENIFLKLKLLV